jgi:hypothetical protein
MDTKSIQAHVESLRPDDRYELSFSKNGFGTMMVITISSALQRGLHLVEGHEFASITLQDSIQYFQATGYPTEVIFSTPSVKGNITLAIDHNVGVNHAIELARQIKSFLARQNQG